MSNFGSTILPPVKNEPVRGYLPGSPERARIKAELDRQASTQVEAPLYIGGKRVSTGNLEKMIMPHDHQHVLGHFHQAGLDEVESAIASAMAARKEWAAMPWEDRAGIFLKAAHLLRDEFRDRMNASTMLNQSKVLYQAEIDAACELVDFWNFDVHYMQKIYEEQPPMQPDGVWNRLEHRPLDGFVFAISPFNFSSIGANLATAPALMGNTVVWKPGPNAMLVAHYIVELLEAAGLPPGVVNMVNGDPKMIGKRVVEDRNLAGIHFTGSTNTFQLLWQQVGQNIDSYTSYPRLVGETGGKDFIFAHASADIELLTVAMARGAFEYQGQKCSAASRAYIPKSLWPELRDRLVAEIEKIGVGDPRDFRNLMGAVIDARAFAKHKAAIDEAKASVGKQIDEVIGGEYDDSKGWFVHPTVIVSNDPKSPTMVNELFGPILTVYVYDDNEFEQTLELCDNTSPYALTGCIMARDRAAVVKATDALRYAAGNFYVNDKPTGAVVGQQPFGGGRKSGTNDKAGAMVNLLKWVSPRTIKENFAAPRQVAYPYMSES